MENYNFELTKEFILKKLFDENIVMEKDSDYPKISIVTPSYNQARFLERTILSVLNQNYPNLEYIIIDGGSTDGSIEIIKKYGKYLAYWISEKDEGQSDAINKGFNKSTGEILAWQNSDDIYLPGVFKQIAEIYNAKKCEIIMGDIAHISKDDVPIRTLRYGPWPKYGLKNVGMLISSQATFWTRDLHMKCEPIRKDLHYAFDTEYFYRLVSNAKKVEHIPEILGCFRIYSNAKQNDTENYNKEDELVKIICSFRRGNFLLNFIEKLIRAIYLILKGNVLYIISPKKDAKRIIKK